MKQIVSAALVVVFLTTAVMCEAAKVDNNAVSGGGGSNQATSGGSSSGGMSSSSDTGATDGVDIEEVLNGYEGDKRPNDGGAPVNVAVSGHVSHLQWKYGEMTLIISFREHWIDARFVHQNNAANTKLDLTTRQERIWTPDTYFGSASEISPLHDTNLLIARGDGQIMRSRRLKIVIPCEQTLDAINKHNDALNCTLSVASYRFAANDVAYLVQNEEKMKVSNAVTRLRPDMECFAQNRTIKTSTGHYAEVDFVFKVHTGITKEVLKHMMHFEM